MACLAHSLEMQLSSDNLASEVWLLWRLECWGRSVLAAVAAAAAAPASNGLLRAAGESAAPPLLLMHKACDFSRSRVLDTHGLI
jgi:hypothetical protein